MKRYDLEELKLEGWVLLFGDPSRRDLDRASFTPDTKMGVEDGLQVPIRSRLQDETWGETWGSATLELRAEGVYFHGALDPKLCARYLDGVLALRARHMLRGTVESDPLGIEVHSGGGIGRFLIKEIGLSVTPLDPNLPPIQ